MSSIAKILLLALMISVGLGIYARADFKSEGKIFGQLYFDSTWEPIVYLSYISTFNEMYSMSNNMIIEKAPVDSLGNFYFDISFLPSNDHLYRIHMVKKDDPPASLIIGGKDENHMFIIANNSSVIGIYNSSNQSLFKDVTLTGSPINKSFQQITEIANFIDSANTNDSLLKKEFIAKATYEKLRYIADTCTHPLLSLYSIYKSKFESNQLLNKQFYQSYLKKWDKNKSNYFKSFREQLLIETKNEKVYGLIIATLLLVTGFILGRITIINKKAKRLDKLSVQERKIFDMLQRGITNQQISEECNIGLSTVKSHVSNIYSKLNIKSRKDAMSIKINK